MLKSPIISTLPDNHGILGIDKKNHGIGECVLFVWSWAVNTKENLPLIVKGEGQLLILYKCSGPLFQIVLVTFENQYAFLFL